MAYGELQREGEGGGEGACPMGDRGSVSAFRGHVSQRLSGREVPGEKLTNMDCGHVEGNGWLEPAEGLYTVVDSGCGWRPNNQ